MDKTIDFIPYTPDMCDEWDNFVRASRNGTFLFQRGYMDYHSDRFRDASLIAVSKGKTVAMLTAEVSAEGILRSHGGLTYGGWILPPSHIDGADILQMMRQWTEYCRRQGYRAIDYRPVPAIYHRRPSQEDIYALFRLGAVWSASFLSSTIDYRDPAGFNTLQRRHLRKAEALGAVISEETDTDAFHSMLAKCLRARHDTVPVHSAAELKLLRSRFPENIRIFTAALDGVPHAGVCMYITPEVAHAQYIATTEEGRRLNLLPLLMRRLIDMFATECRYFDFGNSNEEGGLVLNDGLLRQKFSLGGSGTVYQRYFIDLQKNF